MNFGALKIDNLLCGPQQIDNIIIGSESIFQRRLELVLPLGSSVISLRDFIVANNPTGIEDILVTNSENQPGIISGNLNGLNVEFINNGTIKGFKPGDNGLTLTSVLLLKNNGTIYGAGGNGGNGGRGGRGGTGGKGGTSQSTNTQYHAYTGGTSTYTAWFNGKNLGVEIYLNGRLVLKGPENSTILSDGYTTYTRGLQHVNASFFGFSTSIKITVAGGNGGAGGAGGLGADNGGRGESFSNSKEYGKAGASGANGSTGGTTSSGYAYRGGTGGRGGTRGYGGDGGDWGVDGTSGSKGSQGSRGNTGLSGGTAGLVGLQGSNGKSGNEAGNSILGIEFLATGSDKGTLVGDNIIT